MYKEAKTPLEIEEITRIPGNVIRNWVFKAGIARPKNHYSLEQQQQAISMYSQGISYSEIETVTGVPPSMTKKFAHQAKTQQKVHRKRKSKGGRPPVYSSEFKQTCLDMLAQGKTLVQIEELIGVGAGSIRRWQKDHQLDNDKI